MHGTFMRSGKEAERAGRTVPVYNCSQDLTTPAAIPVPPEVDAHTERAILRIIFF